MKREFIRDFYHNRIVCCTHDSFNGVQNLNVRVSASGRFTIGFFAEGTNISLGEYTAIGKGISSKTVNIPGIGYVQYWKLVGFIQGIIPAKHLTKASVLNFERTPKYSLKTVDVRRDPNDPSDIHLEYHAFKDGVDIGKIELYKMLHTKCGETNE